MTEQGAEQPPLRATTELDSSSDMHATHVEGRLQNLHELLATLDECPRSLDCDAVGKQNQLVQVRLGVASSLYTALRIRHPPTSEHCLRVALGCSTWADYLELTDGQRDQIEIAALLHDVGKIGVPDSILRSPRPLSATEAEIMQQTRLFGRYILSSCSADRSILHIIENIPAWYNGGRAGFAVRGDAIPLGARMIAIVDAFDSMTTDHVYRKARTYERAIAELCENAGTQFDPSLVLHFAQLHATNQIKHNPRFVRRWLRDLHTQCSNRYWELRTSAESVTEHRGTETLFHERLLDSMHDGVIFVDNDACIVRWNRGAERLTGLSGKAVLQHEWLPELVGLRDLDGRAISPDECPVRFAIRSGTQSMQRLLIKGRRSDQLPIDLHAVPVLAASGKRCGATVLVRDATFEANLEQRVQTLHEKATRDPLTGVANRAVFDHTLAAAVEEHTIIQRPCSLIICDIDHFKRINDTYGHQAGDEALVSFTALLQRFSRREDVVARYGGEEFVVVCRDCRGSSAVELAESIREALARTPLAELSDQCITASFGVTELQPGDTPESMLRRADRALMQAKDSGRNRVIQLGCGMDEGQHRESTAGAWWSSWMRPASQHKFECYLVTHVPMNITVQKLRGFVADHNADITSLHERRIVLAVQSTQLRPSRRSNDRPLRLGVHLDFVSTGLADSSQRASDNSVTMIHVEIVSQTRRDRREATDDAVRRTLHGLRAYLMADVYESLEDAQRGLAGRGKSQGETASAP